MTYWFIITGYNCVAYYNQCIESVLAQPGDVRIIVIDDNSDDGTRIGLFTTYLKHARVSVSYTHMNRGAAHARYMAMQIAKYEGASTDDVFCLLDMDDFLPDASVTKHLDQEYGTGAEATYGRYTFLEDRPPWPQEPYDETVLQNRSFRHATWRAWPLRTFKVKYGLRVTPDMLKEPGGDWLKACTDVALMLPILEMVPPGKLHYINHPMYVYRGFHDNVSRKRFGRAYKDEMNRHIRSMPSLVE